jgi:hypothetical protein
MNVAEATDLATEWLRVHAENSPGFRGAHLMGSITALPPSADFPPDGDLDIGILVDLSPPAGQEVIEKWYRGVAIEAGMRGIADYSSPEAVLANPELACHLAVDSIIADPAGMLGGIQRHVARDYGRRRWVIERCRREKDRVLASLDDAGRAETGWERAVHLNLAVLSLSGLLALALLRPPTHRKCLILLREILRDVGKPELHEDALAICGFAGLGAARVSTYLERSAHAFDRAVELKRTPSPYGFKLRSHLRPYLVDSMRPLIAGGEHREAMFWICASLYISSSALQNDAPEAEWAEHTLLLAELTHDLGLDSETSWPGRLRQAISLKDTLFRLADEVVAELP